MSAQKIGIAAECVCDLPCEYLEEHGIEAVRFLIETDSGVFADTDEITSENILEYIRNGGSKTVSRPPEPECYAKIFKRCLEKYEGVIFIAGSSALNRSYENAKKAAEMMNEQADKIRIFDSLNISAGTGQLVLKAVEMAEAGCDADMIIGELEKLRDRISSGFICADADFLCRNGIIAPLADKISETFNAHPALSVKNGRLVLEKLMFGDYENAVMRYIGHKLRKSGGIRRISIVHAGGNSLSVGKIRKSAEAFCNSENISASKACAANSSIFGDRTFGIFFVREDQ